MATLSALVSFNGSDGDYPYGGLIADANGDLFGTTNRRRQRRRHGVRDRQDPTGYASTPTTLVSFNGTDGDGP